MKTKTNKILSLFMMLALVFSTAIAFSSCSNDDKEEESPLVGTWVNTDNSYQDILTIGKDGSWNEKSIDSYSTQYRKGTYTYDPVSRTIIVSIQAVAGSNYAYTMTIYVQSLSTTTLSLVSDSFGSKIYKKQ